MKAPDKIYLNIPKQELEAPLDSTTWDTKEFDNCINVEYIRKDTILELLQNRNKEINGTSKAFFRSQELQEIYWRINEI